MINMERRDIAMRQLAAFGLVFLLLVIISPLAHASWGIVCSFPYCSGGALILEPGDSEVFEILRIQNDPGRISPGTDINVLAVLSEGSEIASLVDAPDGIHAEYLVPYGTKDTTVPIYIEIPEFGYKLDYIVKVSFGADCGGQICTGIGTTILISVVPLTGDVSEDDGCDVGIGGNDVDTVLASSDGASIFVDLTMCAAIDPKVKYRVHFDYTDQTNQDADDTDEAPDTPDNTDCQTTSDDMMMRRGNKDTGPGMITSDTDMVLWYEVDYAELTQNGASLGPGDQLLIWVDTQFKGINDRAPNTESGDTCSKPQVIGEVLNLTLE